MNLSLQYPIFGAEIQCPHCRQTIPALTLTDTYLCPRHGAFEADPNTAELVHLQSTRSWKLWDNEWYRQHTHPDGIRFEIHESLERLYAQGYKATKIIIARRYQDLISAYLDRHNSTGEITEQSKPKLYGLPVDFSTEPSDNTCWDIINFQLEKEPGIPIRYPYFRLLE